MNSTTKNILAGTAAALIAGLATVALPLLDYALNHRPADKPRIVAQVSVKSIQAAPPQARPQRTVRQPERAKPAPRIASAGPRFAMDLGVMGSGGAAAPIDIINKRSGQGGAGDDADGVDEKPAPASPPPFRMPAEVRNREVDAFARMTFCVDASGRPYEIRVAEEKPPGIGMGAEGRNALQQTSFKPARKGNSNVAFCGMEQVFEVRFN
jgi:protein TonB